MAIYSAQEAIERGVFGQGSGGTRADSVNGKIEGRRAVFAGVPPVICGEYRVFNGAVQLDFQTDQLIDATGAEVEAGRGAVGDDVDGGASLDGGYVDGGAGRCAQFNRAEACDGLTEHDDGIGVRGIRP